MKSKIPKIKTINCKTLIDFDLLITERWEEAFDLYLPRRSSCRKSWSCCLRAGGKHAEIERNQKFFVKIRIQLYISPK